MFETVIPSLQLRSFVLPTISDGESQVCDSMARRDCIPLMNPHHSLDVSQGIWSLAWITLMRLKQVRTLWPKQGRWETRVER